jgi:hypothetical protein
VISFPLFPCRNCFLCFISLLNYLHYSKFPLARFLLVGSPPFSCLSCKYFNEMGRISADCFKKLHWIFRKYVCQNLWIIWHYQKNVTFLLFCHNFFQLILNTLFCLMQMCTLFVHPLSLCIFDALTHVVKSTRNPWVTETQMAFCLHHLSSH